MKKKLSKATEAEMRDVANPHPQTKKELAAYIDSLVDRQHDYGTCVYAMSLAANAAFNFVAHKLGVTGFQASCADMDFLKRTRGLKRPFMIIDGENELYPQYDLAAKLAEARAGWRDWIREEAKKKLKENTEYVHPHVLAHWKKLAA